MGEYVSLGSFTAKLNTLENETSFFGKKYNKRKLVKKLIRCLPIRFEACKAVIKVTMKSDEIKFDKLVGLLMASELEQAEDNPTPVKRIAFTENHKDERVKYWRNM